MLRLLIVASLRSQYCGSKNLHLGRRSNFTGRLHIPHCWAPTQIIVGARAPEAPKTDVSDCLPIFRCYTTRAAWSRYGPDQQDQQRWTNAILSN